MKVLGVTLARGGSKGIPNKNIKMIAGKPLLAWTIQEAKKSQYLDVYVVSTDSTLIAKVARKYGVPVVKRPKTLAGDATPSPPALIHAVEKMEKKYGEFDIIVDIRCTNPLKTVDDIDGSIRALKYMDADSVIGISETYPVERIKTLNGGWLEDTYDEPADGQRQFLGKYYVRNGSVYTLDRNILMDTKAIFGHKRSYGWIMPRERSVNIDDMFDWHLAETLLNERDN